MSDWLICLFSLARIFIIVYCGYKFIVGNKHDNETLWYGIWILMALMPNK